MKTPKAQLKKKRQLEASLVLLLLLWFKKQFKPITIEGEQVLITTTMQATLERLLLRFSERIFNGFGRVYLTTEEKKIAKLLPIKYVPLTASEKKGLKVRITSTQQLFLVRMAAFIIETLHKRFNARSADSELNLWLKQQQKHLRDIVAPDQVQYMTEQLKFESIKFLLEQRPEISQQLIVSKQWYTTLDGRERDAHHDAAGQIQLFHIPFLVGGEHLQFPRDTTATLPNIINCRCLLLLLFTKKRTIL